MLDKCQIISMPNFRDKRGQLSVVEGSSQIPFEIKRVYYMYGVPSGFKRGEHAHAILHQLIIPISGSFEISLDDGSKKVQYLLDDPSKGLYVCPMIWRSLWNFSEGAIGLVLASEVYDEPDYIFEYKDFINLTGDNN